jgi:ABC-2 type transport system permease protein
MLSVLRQSVGQVGRSMVFLPLGAAAFHYLVLLASAAFLGDAPREALENAPEFFSQPPEAVEAFLGGSVDFFTPAGWVASAMTHPITLAVFTGAALSVAAGAVAAEVERGTVDLVLARPVGRVRFLLGKAGATVAAVTAAEAGALAGVLAATLTVERMNELTMGDLWRPFLGSWLLFVALGMVGLLLSARSSLRSRAIGMTVAIIVVWYFVNFIALLIDEISGARYASPFHYFRAADFLSGKSIAVDAVALAGLAGVALATALWWFSRRDLTR